MIKVIGTDQETKVDALAEDKSVVVSALFRNPVPDFIGLFGMPNLDKLKILLNLQEYREDADITICRQERNGVQVPVGLHFKNATGDFVNDYRFMTSEVVSERLKTAVFLGANWNIEFEPTVASIMRLKMQSQANSEMSTFRMETNGVNLTFSFGDQSTHAGEFVFQTNVKTKLKRVLSFPVQQVIGILGLVGDKVMKISDDGAMQITVDSGIACYNYILPAQSK